MAIKQILVVDDSATERHIIGEILTKPFSKKSLTDAVMMHTHTQQHKESD